MNTTIRLGVKLLPLGRRHLVDNNFTLFFIKYFSLIRRSL